MEGGRELKQAGKPARAGHAVPKISDVSIIMPYVVVNIKYACWLKHSDGHTK